MKAAEPADAGPLQTCCTKILKKLPSDWLIKSHDNYVGCELVPPMESSNAPNGAVHDEKQEHFHVAENKSDLVIAGKA